MLALSLSRVKKSFGTDVILEDVSLGISADCCTGIVGMNGTGKTTLMKIIAGIYDIDSGSVSVMKGDSVGYLAQDKQVNSELSVWEEAMSVFKRITSMEARLRSMEEQMADLHEDEAFLSAYSALSEEYDRLDGYSCESRARGVLKGLGFTDFFFSQRVSTLSGGQKTRLALAKLLLEQPKLLLLDEPTNHLDLQACTWLENYLKDFKGTVLVVSHDRYFLDVLCKYIIDVENKGCTLYLGNYSEYHKKKEANVAVRRKEYESQQKEIDRQEEIIRRFRSYATEQAIKKAKIWEKKLEKYESAAVDRPVSSDTIHFHLERARLSGNEVLRVEQLGHRFTERWLFRDVNFLLRQGEKVALIGPNGIGKTTILRIINGLLPPAEGSFHLGAKVDIGYYDQEQHSLSESKNAVEEIGDEFPTMTDTEIRNVLGSFLLRGDEVFKPVSELSGGQRARILLAKFILRKNNFLLLDEPTNHLDMESREVLESALKKFDGTLLIVSHDRFFLNQIVDRIIELGGEHINEYLGNYDNYSAKKLQSAEPAAAEAVSSNRTQQKLQLKKEREEIRLRQQKSKRLADLENEIAACEERITELETQLSSSSLYADAASAIKLSMEHREEKEREEALLNEWSTLSGEE